MQAKQTRVQLWRWQQKKSRSTSQMTKVRLEHTKEYGGPNKGRIKKWEIPGDECFFFFYRSGYCSPAESKAMVALEIRPFSHPSLTPAREKLSSVPAKQPPLEQRLGLERRFWAMPFSLPAHFCPAAKRERQRGEREAGKEIMKSPNCAYTLILKYEIHLAFAWKPSALRQKSQSWLGTRRGAVTWTVDYMSSQLTVGLGAASGERNGDRRRKKLD